MLINKNKRGSFPEQEQIPQQQIEPRLLFMARKGELVYQDADISAKST
jgi:hypothetical protein